MIFFPSGKSDDPADIDYAPTVFEDRLRVPVPQPEQDKKLHRKREEGKSPGGSNRAVWNSDHDYIHTQTEHERKVVQVSIVNVRASYHILAKLHIGCWTV